jgi:G:T/U-mismatch repair DNA glycosylase
MKSTVLALALLAGGLALPSLASAQVNPTFSDLNEAVEEARTIIQSERKQLVSQGLALTAEEGAAFWPVYDKYMLDMKAASDLRVKVITDYAANYANLTDPVAKQLITDSLKYQEKVLKIRKGYLGKFRKTLPEVKLARFYQIENKLDAITNFVLADQIPLVPQAPSSAPITPPAR